jgi:DNA-binding beta-propeller fold protein YncE
LVAGATIQGPQLGYVFDNAKKELRPILGIPGAAVLGEALAAGVELRKVAISPRQDYALVVAGEHNQAMVFAMGQPTLTAVMVQGADRGADQIAISAGGMAAALYYQNAGRVEVVTGLPAAPKVSSEIYLQSGQKLTAIAVGDDGHTVLAASGGRVFQAAVGGEVPILSDLGRVTAITIPAAGTAFVADSGNNQIHRVRGIGAGIEADVIAGPKQGISAPVAVEVSRDGSRVFVANAKPGSVSIIDLKGDTAASTIDCACKPTGMVRLAGNEAFRLTEMSNQPMWVLDAGGTEPRLLFIPADAPGSTQQ